MSLHDKFVDGCMAGWMQSGSGGPAESDLTLHREVEWWSAGKFVPNFLVDKVQATSHPRYQHENVGLRKLDAHLPTHYKESTIIFGYCLPDR